MKVTLTDGVVSLRPMHSDDIDALWGIYSPNIFTHMLNKIESKEQLRTWLVSGMEAEGSLPFVVENADTKEIMGTTRIYSIDMINRSCEIGSTFYGEAFQRTAVNTRSKILLLTHCFETLQMIRVQFKADSNNEKSQKALERIGATKEGIMRNERIRTNGLVRHAVVYSIIDSEWPIVKEHLNQLLNKYSK